MDHHEGLKLKWVCQYQLFLLLRIPFILDTPAEHHRKEVYKAQLAQIEWDVKLLQSSEELLSQATDYDHSIGNSSG